MFVGRKNDGGIATPKGSGLGTNPRAHQKGFQSHNDCRCLENAERFQRSLTLVAELWWTRVFCVAIAGNRGGRVDGIDHDERSIDPSDTSARFTVDSTSFVLKNELTNEPLDPIEMR